MVVRKGANTYEEPTMCSSAEHAACIVSFRINNTSRHSSHLDDEDSEAQEGEFAQGYQVVT